MINKLKKKEEENLQEKLSKKFDQTFSVYKMVFETIGADVSVFDDFVKPENEVDLGKVIEFMKNDIYNIIQNNFFDEWTKLVVSNYVDNNANKMLTFLSIMCERDPVQSCKSFIPMMKTLKKVNDPKTFKGEIDRIRTETSSMSIEQTIQQYGNLFDSVFGNVIKDAVIEGLNSNPDVNPNFVNAYFNQGAKTATQTKNEPSGYRLDA